MRGNTYIAQIIKVHYDYKLNTEYVSNFDMDCTLKLHNNKWDCIEKCTIIWG